MTETETPDGALVAMVGQTLAAAAKTGPVNPQWFADMCTHLTADEITDVLDYSMRLTGTPDVWRELIRDENRRDARTLAGRKE